MPRVACEHCGTYLNARDELINKRVKCPKCGQAFRVTVGAHTPAAMSAAWPEPATDVQAPQSPSTYFRDDTAASDPGNVSLSREKLLAFYPDFFSLWGLIKRLNKMFSNQAEWRAAQIDEHLRLGDSRAAVVMSIDPLLVAAYSDEFDCVAMLKFPAELVAQYTLKPGTKLLTVNSYMPGPKERLPADLTARPGSMGNWHNFNPFIADFLSDDTATITARKRAIAASEWQRTVQLGTEYLRARPGKARDGRPLKSQWPCVTGWF